MIEQHYNRMYLDLYPYNYKVEYTDLYIYEAIKPNRGNWVRKNMASAGQTDDIVPLLLAISFEHGKQWTYRWYSVPITGHDMWQERKSHFYLHDTFMLMGNCKSWLQEKYRESSWIIPKTFYVFLFHRTSDFNQLT